MAIMAKDATIKSEMLSEAELCERTKGRLIGVETINVLRLPSSTLTN
jgi:hypothetical protein